MPPKKKGGKKGKAADWGDSGDDVDPLKAAAAAPPSDDDAAPAPPPPPPPRAKAKKAAKKATSAAAAFALLDDDDDGAASPDPSDGDEPSPVARRGSGSGAGGFAALLGGDDDEPEEGEEVEVEDEPTGLVTCRILSVAPHPNADRLRVAQVDGGAGLGTLTVVTNSAAAAAGVATVLAPAGVTTAAGVAVAAASVRGVASAGMLCSGADAGWVDEADGVLILLPPDTAPGAPVGRTPPAGALFGAAAEKAAKKAAKKAAAAAALAALEAEAGGDAAPADAGLAKKKKKKSTADLGAAFAALEADAAAAAGGDDAPAAPPLDGDAAKKKKKKKSTADLGDLLASLEAGGAGDAAAAAAPPKDDKKKKKKKKDEAAAAAEAAPQQEEAAPAAAAAAEPTGDPEIDALLAAIENPDVPAPGAAGGGGGKKKKKKGKAAAAGGGVDDVDAALAELGLAPAAADAAADAAPAAATEAVPADAAAAAAPTGELTAAQKKKLKAKAKAKAKKAAGGDDGGDAPAAAAAPADAAAASTKPAKGPSAAVRRMQEALERRQAAEAAAKAEEEARLAAEEAAERAAAEEEARKKADAEAKKARQKERRAELKRQGLLLTGKAKKEAERLAAVRAQFLGSAGGEPSADGGGGDGAPPRPKKAVYEKKKKAKPTATASSAASVAASVDDEAAAEPAPAPEPAAAAPAPPSPPASPSSEDDAADAWDEMDLDAVAVPVAKPFAGEDDDGASGASDADGAPAAPPPRAAANGAAKKAGAGGDDDDGASSTEYSGSDDDDDDDDESGSESDSGSDYSDSSADSEEARERLLAACKARRAARFDAARARALAAGDADAANLRSPICCILGHVDTGKTKLLDNVRRTSVQEGEAGGITQQIGATYIPADAIARRTAPLRPPDQAAIMPGLALPGLLVIDTPGHESFSNLRSRGSGLCDIAVLVVDLMHGLEPQTIESIGLLKMRKTPFIVALNKVDRLFDWKPTPDAGFRAALAAQAPHVVAEFEKRLAAAKLALNEQGLNVALYDENPDPRKYVSVVPTSAVTGEGVPDLLAVLVTLTQSMMAGRLTYVDETQCTVLEVKVIEGLGTTVDVVLVNGTLREGDTIVACGLGAPIVATIRSLLTPHPLKELRVKGSYQHHKQVRAAQGVKICAHGLESAVAGTPLFVVQPGDDVEGLKLEAMEDMHDIFASVDRTGEGVCAQASTLGSLEALLEFLRSPDVAIPVSGIAIGPVHKRDVMRASVMLEKGRRKYACILAFDVPVTKEARELADELGVRVFMADIIYHLFDQFTAYLKKTREDEAAAARQHAAFPCVLKIIPTCVFNKKDPIVLGVEVEEGVAAIGTPLCVPSQGGLDVGRIASLELNHKAVDKAHKGDSVAMKIEATCANEAARMFGRHFDADDRLVSRVTRRSIDLLKTHFRDELGRDDWVLVVKLKKLFNID